MWRQDLAILSPEGPRDNACQLRPRVRTSMTKLPSEKLRAENSFPHIFFFLGGGGESKWQPLHDSRRMLRKREKTHGQKRPETDSPKRSNRPIVANIFEEFGLNKGRNKTVN